VGASVSTWEAGDVRENGFKIAWAELKRRTRKPRGEVVYWCYFVFAVCVLGGVGVLLEFARFVSAKETVSPDGLFTAFVTFFPALIGSSAMQIMFDKVNDRRMMAISVSSLILTLGVSAALILLGSSASKFSWGLASLFCVFALWVWWIANADNPGLYDNPPPPIDAPTGGPDPNMALQGNTEGFVS